MTDLENDIRLETPAIDQLIPTPEQAELLLASAEAREARREARLADLPTPDPDDLRGRVRESMIDDPEAAPPTIAPFVIVALGKRLDHRKLPLFDQFTASYHFSASEDYQRYVAAPPRRNKDKTERPAVDPTRDERQVTHVADRVQGEIRTNLRVAHERLAGLRATRRAVKAGQLLLPNAAVSAADAIEDMAFGLRENPGVFRGIPYAGALDRDMEHVGKHAGLHPEDLYDLDLLMKFTVREQLKRRGYWQNVLKRVLSADIDRRTPRQEQEAAELRTKIADLNVYTDDELAAIR